MPSRLSSSSAASKTAILPLNARGDQISHPVLQSCLVSIPAAKAFRIAYGILKEAASFLRIANVTSSGLGCSDVGIWSCVVVQHTTVVSRLSGTLLTALTTAYKQVLSTGFCHRDAAVREAAAAEQRAREAQAAAEQAREQQARQSALSEELRQALSQKQQLASQLEDASTQSSQVSSLLPLNCLKHSTYSGYAACGASYGVADVPRRRASILAQFRKQVLADAC